MASAARPFDDFRALLQNLPQSVKASRDAAAQHSAGLVKPEGSLGRLEDIVTWLAGWQGRDRPRVDKPFTVVFAANHGVAAQGVSDWNPKVTRQMVETIAAGGGAVNQIAATYGIGLKIFELALDYPTGDITNEAALDEKAAAATIAFGMEAIAGEPDLLCLGEMGIGNTTIAAAIYCALYGGTAKDWAGRGRGQDDAGFDRKCRVIDSALSLHRDYLSDPLEIMRRLGGREICALAGAIIAARLQRIPVVLDGYVVCAAAAILRAMNSSALDHCIAGHVSAQVKHGEVLRRLNKEPVLDLGMALGEGTGATLAAAIIKAAVACHNDMATFEQANVSRRE